MAADPGKKQQAEEHVLGLTFENSANLNDLKQALTKYANGLTEVIKKDLSEIIKNYEENNQKKAHIQNNANAQPTGPKQRK